jgi:hypothetical protein
MLEFKYGDVCSSQNKIVTYNNCAACKRRISLLIFDEDENTLKVKCAQEKPPCRASKNRRNKNGNE